MIVGFVSVPISSAQELLTTLQQIYRLSNAQASRQLPATFQATVTYFRAYSGDLFVQDGDSAIYIHAVVDLNLVPGDRILVRGVTHEGFRPYVNSNDITLVGHGSLPEPVSATYDEMIRGQVDCKLVKIHATILAADIVSSSAATNSALLVPGADLRVIVDGEHADANLDTDDASALKNLLDADAEITAVVGGRFDNKMQLTGILFHIQSLHDVKVIKPAAVDPWSLPLTPMDRVITGYHVRDFAQRMRIHGTITYYQPGSGLVLQDGTKSMWVSTQTYNPLRVGDAANAIGFPEVQNGFLTLNRGEVRDSSVPAPVVPPLLTWKELASGGSKVFDLVSIKAQVVTEVRQATQDVYVLKTDGHLFSAIFHPPLSTDRTPILPMKDVPVGSRVRLTGICMLEDANPFNGDVPFNILMRSYDDIAVIANPSWVSVRNLLYVAGLLLLLLFAAGARSLMLERGVRRTTAAAAYLEQRRSRVLEDINAGRPLHEILEQITQLVSFRLQGAACWCQIADGTPIGAYPMKLNALRVVRGEIPARAGASHGAIFAAFDARTKPQLAESEALNFAAGLATLAIETSQLYSDLVHRSEFDLLTDTQNRFSLEKTLDSLIRKARIAASSFGLIYIDLNGFKKVNDLYGHHVGDIYLQEVAQRMKRQLRPCDILARIGGDEFVTLVSAVHNRSEVDEIARRLKRCFDLPFEMNDPLIHGSASIGIAVFPEDAETKDGLLRAADAAMYLEKHASQKTEPATKTDN
jgi:diguanylate cyclase (GGDEF)-like protein